MIASRLPQSFSQLGGGLGPALLYPPDIVRTVAGQGQEVYELLGPYTATRWGDLLNYTWELNGTDLIGHGEELNATLPPGRHAVTLIVRDLSGAFDTVSVELSVAAVEPPPVIIDNGSKPPARSWWRDFFVAGGLLVILLMAIVAAFLLTRRGARGAAEESSDAAVAKAIVKKKQGGGKKGKLPPKRPEPSAADEEPYGEADDALDVKAVGEEGEPK